MHQAHLPRVPTLAPPLPPVAPIGAVVRSPSTRVSSHRARLDRPPERAPEIYGEICGKRFSVSLGPRHVVSQEVRKPLFLLMKKMVRKGGLEPPRYCYRQPLKLVRLPIPPLPQRVLVSCVGQIGWFVCRNRQVQSCSLWCLRPDKYMAQAGMRTNRRTRSSPTAFVPSQGREYHVPLDFVAKMAYASRAGTER